MKKALLLYDRLAHFNPNDLTPRETPNGGVDAAARIHSSIAGPIKLRNTLPPLASNDLLYRGLSDRFARSKVGFEIIALDHVCDNLFDALSSYFVDKNHVGCNEIFPIEAFAGTTILASERKDVLVGEKCGNPPRTIFKRNNHICVVVTRRPFARSPLLGFDPN
jgi:hypothetical protein